MGFIYSYKRLEKLCGDIYGTNHGISAYIEEMTELSSSALRISGWDDDLKQLKHYRWIRNQIVHEPDCDEDNMCDSTDVAWIDYFYDRIMKQTDPLSLYYNVTANRTAKPIRSSQHSSTTKTITIKNLVKLAVILIIVAVVYCLYL